MLTKRVIPCLDCRGGRVVKGVKFSGLRDVGDPVALASAYQAQGADEIVVLDISATPEERETQGSTVWDVRDVLGVPLTVGGGVRSLDDARNLLRVGADKVGINTAAVRRPELVRELADSFGRQCVVVAVDARGTGDGRWEVVVRSGSEASGVDVCEWVQRVADLGAGEILLTSWDRDGTRDGYDLDLLRAVREAVNIPIIASGGADSAADMVAGLQAGADAVLAASIFHDGDTTVQTIKEELAAGGVEVRL